MEQDEAVLRVKDLMTSNLICVSFETSVMEAARAMSMRDISSVLITSGENFIGILTDRDVIKKVVALGLDPKEIMVEEVMSKPLVMISENVSADKAAEIMRDNKIRRVVVKSKIGVVGIISESDLVRVEPELHFLIREHSRVEFHPSSLMGSNNKSFTGFCEECENYSEDLERYNGRWVCEECRT